MRTTHRPFSLLTATASGSTRSTWAGSRPGPVRSVMTPQALPRSRRLAMQAQSQSASWGKSADGRCSSGGVGIGSRLPSRNTSTGRVETASLRRRTQANTTESLSARSVETGSPAAVGAGARSPMLNNARSWVRRHGHCQGIGSGLSPSRRLGLGRGVFLDLGGVAAALGTGVRIERVGGRAPEATPDDAHGIRWC
jgi:hypothetical protein